MKLNIQKIILYTMLSTIVFAFGRTFGYVQCQKKYKADYEYQGLQIDTLQQKTIVIKSTFDSIKKTPCYQQYYKNK